MAFDPDDLFERRDLLLNAHVAEGIF